MRLPTRKMPLALIPAVPAQWSSIWQVREGMLEMLRQVGVRVMPVSVYRRPSPTELRQLAGASCWIVVYGGVSQGILPFLASLAIRDRPPLLLMANGEGAKGVLTLAGHSKFLRSEDRIIVTSMAEKKLLESAFPETRRVSVSPIPVCRKMFKPLDTKALRSFRRSLGLKPSQPLILYAGRLSYQKNIHLLLKAFARARTGKLKQARLILLGGLDQLGEPHLGKTLSVSYGHSLAKLAADLGIEDSVEFRGPVSQDELRKFFSACDLHVSLTTHFGEDFGYAVAQGLAAGAPTLVTRWGGGLDFVEAGAASGIPVKLGKAGPEVDVGAAARSIRALLLSPARNQKAGDHARAFAESRLSRGAVGSLYREWIREASRLRAGDSWLVPSRETREFLLGQYGSWMRDPTAARLFAGYRDPAYRRICRAYSGLRI